MERLEDIVMTVVMVWAMVLLSAMVAGVLLLMWNSAHHAAGCS